jgi:hypothetical protein
MMALYTDKDSSPNELVACTEATALEGSSTTPSMRVEMKPLTADLKEDTITLQPGSYWIMVCAFRSYS